MLLPQKESFVPIILLRETQVRRLLLLHSNSRKSSFMVVCYIWQSCWWTSLAHLPLCRPSSHHKRLMCLAYHQHRTIRRSHTTLSRKFVCHFILPYFLLKQYKACWSSLNLQALHWVMKEILVMMEEIEIRANDGENSFMTYFLSFICLITYLSFFSM